MMQSAVWNCRLLPRAIHNGEICGNCNSARVGEQRQTLENSKTYHQIKPGYSDVKTALQPSSSQIPVAWQDGNKWQVKDMRIQSLHDKKFCFHKQNKVRQQNLYLRL